jgi:hypothetical protein
MSLQNLHSLISLYSNSRDVINIITLRVILILALTVTHGQRSNFAILLPISGLHFRSLRHVSAHVPSSGSYIRGIVGNFTIYQFLASAAATIAAHPVHL